MNIVLKLGNGKLNGASTILKQQQQQQQQTAQKSGAFCKKDIN